MSRPLTVDPSRPTVDTETRLPGASRPRRTRVSAAMRDLVAETAVRPEHLVTPFFVVPGRDEVQPIAALPGVSRYSVDRLLPQLERALKLGVRAAVLFGVVPTELKDADGTAATATDGPVVTALRAARAAFGDDLVLITDVCLCGYTDHGHCGVLAEGPRGVVVDNDRSLPRLAAMAVRHAEAGADLVSPSDMMDGRVGAIRQALDRSGFLDVGILAYAVKYASAFYGPFRDAAGSAPKGHAAEDPSNPRASVDAAHAHPVLSPPEDRTTYQMDPRNAREALREASLDELEGADALMVKPALPYLDILARLRPRTNLPLAAYFVSGEYAMIKAATAAGALHEPSAVREALTSIRRAGADLVLTYHAIEALEGGWL